MKLETIIVCALAAWRVTSLLVHEDGPFLVFARLREAAGVDWQEPTFFGKLLGCFWCTSVWVATAVALLATTPVWWLLVPFALSGAAILAEQIMVDDGE